MFDTFTTFPRSQTLPSYCNEAMQTEVCFIVLFLCPPSSQTAIQMPKPDQISIEILPDEPTLTPIPDTDRPQASTTSSEASAPICPSIPHISPITYDPLPLIKIPPKPHNCPLIHAPLSTGSTFPFYLQMPQHEEQDRESDEAWVSYLSMSVMHFFHMMSFEVSISSCTSHPVHLSGISFCLSFLAIRNCGCRTIDWEERLPDRYLLPEGA